jgi:hypothetical protein
MPRLQGNIRTWALRPGREGCDQPIQSTSSGMRSR